MHYIDLVLPKLVIFILQTYKYIKSEHNSDTHIHKTDTHTYNLQLQ